MHTAQQPLIRVLIVDDHAIVRIGIRAILSTMRDVEVVGEADNGRDAVALTAQLSPNVVTMDLLMPDCDGRAALQAIAATAPAARVLIVSMRPPRDELIPLMQMGAAGYVHKAEADRELPDAVRIVARRGTYTHTSAAAVLRNEFATEFPAERIQYGRLTDRERSVLQLTGKGYNAPEIGEQLRISAKTVESYKARIQDKVGLSKRWQYVRFAHRLGLLAEAD